MGMRDSLEEALDQHGSGAGSVSVTGDGDRSATVDVEAVGPIGVKIRGVQVDRGGPIDVQAEAEALAGGLRSLGEPLQPTEVDPSLGGAVLRTRPEDMRDREFFEVDVQQSGKVGVKRFQVDDEGDRSQTDFGMTRDQLGRLLDEL